MNLNMGSNQNDANSSYNQKPNATTFTMKDPSRGARHLHIGELIRLFSN